MVGAVLVWVVAAVVCAGILLRPFGIREWTWACAGAAVVVASGALPLRFAGAALLDGLDVYCFLAGMLALAELARVTGVFDALASWLAGASGGSSKAVFWLVYAAGVIVTALLSNDATIVLLTPAALALARKAGVSPLPPLFGCAFVANAASFVLPISNPANLLVFAHLPPAGSWLGTFALPSAAAIAVTGTGLALVFRRSLHTRPAAPERAHVSLPGAGALSAVLVSGSAVAVIVASSAGVRPGSVALICAAVSLAIAACMRRAAIRDVLRGGPWSIVPLVAGLFVVVRALDQTGVLQYARAFVRFAGSLPPLTGKLVAGTVVSIADAAINNLPAGVLARYALAPHASAHIANAALIAIDLGPNLSLSGSLASLLWLVMLRRASIEVTPWEFTRTGLLLTVPALVIALILV